MKTKKISATQKKKELKEALQTWINKSEQEKEAADKHYALNEDRIAFEREFAEVAGSYFDTEPFAVTLNRKKYKIKVSYDRIFGHYSVSVEQFKTI